MRIRLVSTDHRVGCICREILSKLGTGDHQLLLGMGKGPCLEDDLYVWDLADGPSPWYRKNFSAKAAHILLVEHGKIGEVKTAVSRQAFAALLKPVQRDCLEALFELALKRYTSLAENPGVQTNGHRWPADDAFHWSLLASLRLQEIGLTQTDLLARCLHDLRSPMTSTDGYCRLLVSGRSGPLSVQQLEMLRRMIYSLKRLSRMTMDTLRLVAGERRRQTRLFQLGDPQSCLNHALDEIAPLAMAKRIGISAEITPPAGVLSFDQLEIERVLINLLENACKFTPVGGKVQIKGYSLFWERRRCHMQRDESLGERRAEKCRRSNAYRIDIVDSGSGIPEQELAAVFEAYVSRSARQDRASLGLGLAISKTIIDDHNGDIFAPPRKSGAGFSFVLPFVPSALCHKPIASELPRLQEQAVV